MGRKHKEKKRREREQEDHEHEHEQKQTESTADADAETEQQDSDSDTDTTQQQKQKSKLKHCNHIKSVNHTKVRSWLNKIKQTAVNPKSTDLSLCCCLHCGVIESISETRTNNNIELTTSHNAKMSNHHIVLRFAPINLHLFCLHCGIELDSHDTKLSKHILPLMKIINSGITDDANSQKSSKHSKRIIEDGSDQTTVNDDSNPSPSAASHIHIQSPPISSTPARGLINPANACFANSTLQCLASTIPLHQYYEQIEANLDLPLQSALQKLILSLNSSNSSSGNLSSSNSKRSNPTPSAVHPGPLLVEVSKLNPFFSGKQQQDSHEFLLTLMNGIRDEYDHAKSANARSSLYKQIRSWDQQQILSFIQQLTPSLTTADQSHLAHCFGSSFSGPDLLQLIENWHNKIGKKLKLKYLSSCNSQIKQALSHTIKRIEAGNFKLEQDQTEHDNNDTNSNTTTHNESHYIDRLFSGRLQNTVECLSCHTISHTYEPFIVLSIPIQPPIQQQQQSSNGKSNRLLDGEYDDESTPFPTQNRRKKHQQSGKHKNRQNRKLHLSQFIDNSRDPRQVAEAVEARTDAEAEAEAEAEANQQDDDDVAKDSQARDQNLNLNHESANREVQPEPEPESESQSQSESQSITDNDIVQTLAAMAQTETETESAEDKQQDQNQEQQDSTSTTDLDPTAGPSNLTQNQSNNHYSDVPSHLQSQSESGPSLDSLSARFNSIQINANQNQNQNQNHTSENPIQQPVNTQTPTAAHTTVAHTTTANTIAIGYQRLRGSTVRLMDCLLAYFDPDLLTGTNQYGCEYCTLQQQELEQKRDSSAERGQGIAAADGDTAAVDGNNNDNNDNDNDNNNNNINANDPESDSDSEPSTPAPAKRQLVKCDAVKRSRLSEPPPILILQLKRFQSNGKGRLEKCEKSIQFQEIIDLQPISSNNQATDSNASSYQYSLYGIVSHSGSLSHGHYISLKRHLNGEWYSISDSHVQRITMQQVFNSQPYILFYQRIDRAE